MAKQFPMWRRVFHSRDVDSCREVGRLMQTVIDGEADASTYARVTRHLEACRRCGLEADTYRSIKASVAAQSPIKVDPKAVADLESFARRLTHDG